MLICIWVINFRLYLENVSRGTTHKRINSFSPHEFLIKLKYYLSHNLSIVPDFFRVSLLAINKFNVKNTSVLV